MLKIFAVWQQWNVIYDISMSFWNMQNNVCRRADLCKLSFLFPGWLLETAGILSVWAWSVAEFAKYEDFNLNWWIFCKTLKVQSEADGVK